jgi:NAD(P)-dependent dehydrogenase (short-subunit alcohol dehydrogenase family)
MTFAVVTGANRGIGLELARQLAARGDTVVAACRVASPELEAVAGVEIAAGVDVADEAGVAKLSRQIGDRRVDLLINNAGVLTRESFDDLDFDRMRRQFEVNTLGPLRVTRALAANLGAGSKVAIVSSRIGSLADNGSGGNYGYRVSKAGVNMVGMNLWHDLHPQGIAVILLHPGYVDTEMTGHKGPTAPADAARGLIARIDEATPAACEFRHATGEMLPW